MNCLATVIVLSYENFEYIYETLNSILAQDYCDIELLVADDGSHDFPKSEIELFINKNKNDNIRTIQVYSNTQNLGTVKNLNRAIKRSKGNYIINISSDDVFFDKSVVSSIVQRLEHSKNGVITCRRLLCDKKLSPLRFMPTDLHIREIQKSMCNHRNQHAAFVKGEFYEFASGSCTYYKKDKLIADGLFNEKYRLLEDYSHFLEITRKYQIETAYDIISIYYRSGGISSIIPKSLLADYITMLNDELLVFSKELSDFERRYLHYNIERFTSDNSFFINFKYFDIFLVRVIYKIKCIYYSKQAIKRFKKAYNNFC